MNIIKRQVDGKPLTITIEYPYLDEHTKKIIHRLEQLDLKICGSKDGKEICISASDIYYIESVERRTFIYTKSEVYTIGRKLYEIEEDLQGSNIVRISKSCLMNVEKLYCVRQLANSQLEATLDNEERLIVGRTYLKDIKRLIQEIM
ncbi:MAG: LytTR family transcriptional regulator DNA-binding domain-containing protein [Lachnospiraceae bacterium]|nr:LytTR family transcriptional regulator DNA-binding domain-containing protein [Lachnospiraceae bacterium]